MKFLTDLWQFMMARKKLLLISLFVPALLVNVQAQNSEVFLGVGTTVEATQLNFTEQAGYSEGSAASAGLALRWNKNEHWFLSSELQFSVKRYMQNNGLFLPGPIGPHDVPLETRVDLYFFSIPLLVGLRALNGDRFEINPALGFQFEFLSGGALNILYLDGSTRPDEFNRSAYPEIWMALRLNIGASYKINDRFLIVATPTISFGLDLQGQNSNNEVSYQSISYGGILQLLYKI